MSDGISNVAGEPRKATIGGKEFQIARYGPRHDAAVEAHILDQRPNPLDMLAEKEKLFPESWRPHLAKAAIEAASEIRSVSADEERSYLRSIKGVAFFFYILAKENHSGLTLQECERLVEGEGAPIVDAKLYVASGMADLKKSVGREADPAWTSTKSPGQSSTDDSTNAATPASKSTE